MASASSRDLTTRVTDIATCPICQEMFDSPKSLPCLHTFCLKCIEGHCEDRKPGDELSCPVCREKFMIPDSGIQGLINNIFVSDLLDARKSDLVISPRDVPCEVCLAASGEAGSSVVASTMYCVDCDQRLCERCSRPRRQMKGGPHTVVPMWNGLEMDRILAQCDKCDKHKNDDAALHCFDCKMDLCGRCFTEEHHQHKCYYTGTAAARCVELIDADMELMKGRVDGARNEISRLEEERRKFLTGVEEVGEKIVERCEELNEEWKQLVDKQLNELMLEVQVLRTETCKEIDSHKENVDMKLVEFETFRGYWNELKAEGKHCELIRAANELHTRTTELLKTDVTFADYRAPAVTFRPDVNAIHELLEGGQNLVGVVNPKEMMIAGLVFHTLPEAQPVYAVTSLDDELFVLRNKGDGVQVDVYNAATTTTTTSTTSCSAIRHLSVPGLKTTVDMTSCKHYRCLYIADRGTYRSRVHKVELNGKVSKWSLANNPESLSVTSQFTVIVTSPAARLLTEFTTHGKQLREIDLQPNIPNPYHAIQLSNGQFVVCHGHSGNPVSRVCIVDSNGDVAHSYGGPPGSATVGQLNWPCHLAVDKDGFIFVLDLRNSRVLLLSPTLSFVREVVSRDQFKWNPHKMFLDIDRRRLYVAENVWKGKSSKTSGDKNYRSGRVVVVHLK